MRRRNAPPHGPCFVRLLLPHLRARALCFLEWFARNDPFGRVPHGAGVSFEQDEEGANTERAFGAKVRALHPYGLATRAGLQVGDLVLTINGRGVNTSLLAAGALRDAIGDVWLGVYRPTEAVPQHVEERDIGLRLDERDEAAAIRSAMLARPKASDTNPVSSPPALPPLRITAAQQAKESENFDIGQLTARALTGIGHSISQLLNPQEHVASTRITADFRGYVQRSTYLNQRASAIALQVRRRGRGRGREERGWVGEGGWER